jgi:hypothetical protein
MAILDNIKNIFKAKKQEKIYRKEAPIVYYNSLGYDSVPKIAYHDLATDGYTENAIVYRCVNENSKQCFKS